MDNQLHPLWFIHSQSSMEELLNLGCVISVSMTAQTTRFANNSYFLWRPGWICAIMTSCYCGVTINGSITWWPLWRHLATALLGDISLLFPTRQHVSWSTDCLFRSFIVEIYASSRRPREGLPALPLHLCPEGRHGATDQERSSREWWCSWW